MTINIVIPCCGQSTRYPNLRPKFLLTHPNGNSMLAESIKGLKFQILPHPYKINIYVVILKEHEDKYKFIGKIDSQFKKEYQPKWIILDKPTESQCETVYKATIQEKIEGNLSIKDCDNYFEIDLKNEDYVAVRSLYKETNINPGNKSYIRLGHDGRILQIKEKEIISPLFCCGLYSFKNTEDFIKVYEHKQYNFISEIIDHSLHCDHSFKHYEVENYIDWGTKEDWLKYCQQFKVFFVDIDGVLVENSAEYMEPQWGTTNGIQKNIDIINKLYNSGKSQIILTTSRKKDYEKITKLQLISVGLKYHKIIFDIQHGKRIIINDFSDTNPYKSCDAINLTRNADILEKLI